MNIKNKRGITLVVLIVTIVVMLILFGITYVSGIGLVRESKKEQLKAMLKMVQSRAQILLDDYLFKHDGEELANIDDSIIASELKGKYAKKLSDINPFGYDKGITNGKVPSKDDKIYCIWDATVLESQGIDTQKLTNGDIIAVEYDIKSGEVDVASDIGYKDTDTNKKLHSLKELAN